MMVFRLSKNSINGKGKLSTFKKLALYEVLGYIGMIYKMYSTKRRSYLMEDIFQSFADNMPYYMSSSVVS